MIIFKNISVNISEGIFLFSTALLLKERYILHLNATVDCLIKKNVIACDIFCLYVLLHIILQFIYTMTNALKQSRENIISILLL